MKNRFVISENDRRNILSMYGLLTEEEKEYGFSGNVKYEKNESIDSPQIYIKKELPDGKLKTVDIITADENGDFEKKVKLDNTLKYFFEIQEGSYIIIKKEIDLTKTDQTNLEFILKKGADVIELEEFVTQVFYLTSFSIDVKDTKNTPINDYNLKIIIDDKEVLNKKFSDSKIDLSFLKNDLLLNDLEKDKFYASKPEDGDAFNQKGRNVIKNVKFIINKNDYEEKTIDYNLKFNNSSIPLKSKITNDGEYITYDGTEEIKVSEGNENIINVELSKPPTNLVNNITGQIKVMGPISNIINGPKNISLELYGFKKDENKIYEPVLLKKTVTTENGYFDFIMPNISKLSDFEYLEISFDGEKSFKPFTKKISVNDIVNNQTTIETGDYAVGDVVLNNSEGYDEDNNLPTITSYCKSYKTTKRKIYGVGVSENISNNDALNMAITNAIKNFTGLYPKYEILEYQLINDPKTYKVICNKSTKQKREVVVRLIPKELKKYVEYKDAVEIPSVKFRDLEFTDAIYRSFESKQKIFIIFTGNDSNSIEVLKKLNSNIDVINLLNEEYINLNYEVNISNREKYLIASNSLEVYSYPYVVILEGIKDPNTTTNLKDTYRVLKKYGMKNDLMNLNVDSF